MWALGTLTTLNPTLGPASHAFRTNVRRDTKTTFVILVVMSQKSLIWKHVTRDNVCVCASIVYTKVQLRNNAKEINRHSKRFNANVYRTASMERIVRFAMRCESSTQPWYAFVAKSLAEESKFDFHTFVYRRSVVRFRNVNGNRCPRREAHLFSHTRVPVSYHWSQTKLRPTHIQHY
jgi:uncharacterized protein YaiI (UPF0178 family)